MRLISDVDGPLLIDRSSEFCDWANLQPEVTVPWSYAWLLETGDWGAATGGLSPAITHALFERFTRSKAYSGMQATPGASGVLWELNEGVKHIATSRSGAVQEETMGFLERHYGPFASSNFGARKEEKAELARELRASYFIDDDPHVLERITSVSPTTRPILFPSRATRTLSGLSGVLVLEAESCVRDDMSPKYFEFVCKFAWKEIASILQNGH